MRIISGEYKGRKLHSVPGKNTRPTSDKVKESLFNSIGPFFDGGQCLDLYSGSGALGIEAVSRGIEGAVLVEKERPAFETIQRNVEVTKETEKFCLMRMPASSALKKIRQKNKKFDLVFLDPPYAEQQVKEDLMALQNNELLNEGCLVICETAKHVSLQKEIGHFCLWKNHLYGATHIWIFEFDLGGNLS